MKISQDKVFCVTMTVTKLFKECSIPDQEPSKTSSLKLPSQIDTVQMFVTVNVWISG